MAAMNDGRPPDETPQPRVGRPRKSQHEKRRKQQQATKWRDARRVYLGNSCDRWKKLKGRIGLKDNSLAWHLMEAHESHCVECGKGTDLCDDHDDTPRDFYPQLIKSIRRICLQYIGFQHTVEVVGLVCLEIDKGSKENFSIKELVTRPIGLRVEALAHTHRPPKDLEPETSIDDEYDDDDDDDERMDDDDDVEDLSDSNDEHEDPEDTSLRDHCQTSEGESAELLKGGNSVSFCNENEEDADCDNVARCSEATSNQIQNNPSPHHSNLSPMQTSPWSPSPDMVSESAKLNISRFVSEIDSESTDSRDKPIDMAVVKAEERLGGESFVICRNPLDEESVGIIRTIDRNVEEPITVTPPPSSGETTTDQQTSPIDLKVVKEEPKDQLQMAPDPTGLPIQNLTFAATTPDHSGKKRKFGCMEPLMNSHKKEVFHKEEYEVLELTPFTDYAEFSRHCPTVLQRTFYRWKRRIKDEYIFLEQHPDLSYVEYIQYVPHAKENVFNFWKSLMKKGYLFGTGSTSHLSAILVKSEFEGRKAASPVSNPTQWDDENNGHKVLKYMQKNLTVEYSELLKHFPDIPEHVFKIWKQQNLQAWKFLEQNFSIDYPLFSRCFPAVSEDVFNIWRQHVLSDNRSKIMSLQREAVSTAEHIQEAQKALWTSLMSQRLAQEQSRYSLSQTTWPALSSGWLGEYPYWGTAMNLSSIGHLDSNQNPQIQKEGSVNESVKSASSVSSDISSRTDTGSVSALDKSVKTDPEDADSYFLSKSKKQNKVEFYYYLQHPDMDFTEMTSSHPSVSLRTFYRWKKEIKTAFAYLQEVPECTFESFHSFFPEIPKEIVEQWRSLVKKDFPQLPQATQDVPDSRKHDIMEKLRVLLSADKSAVICDNSGEQRDDNLGFKGDDKTSRKANEQEFCYLQLHPTVDFAAFTYQFPHISLRVFYHWRREIQDQLNCIRRDPSISYKALQRAFPEVTEEVFNVWKSVVQSEKDVMDGVDGCDYESVDLSTHQKDSLCNESLTDLQMKASQKKKVKLSSINDQYSSQNRESPSICDNQNFQSPRTSGKALMKASRPEYCFLQQNPDIDLHSFIRKFPDMSPGTFYRWRREIKAILDYMASHQDISCEKLVADFPEVTQELFLLWKQKLQSSEEKSGTQEQNPIRSLQALVNDGETYTTKQTYQREPGFTYLLENPHTSFEEFDKLYPAVSPGMCVYWKKLIKDWFSLLKVSPDINFQSFSLYCTEVPEVVFNKWKELIAKREEPLEDLTPSDTTNALSAGSVNSPEDWVLTKTRKVNQTEYLFFLMNPYMDYTEFSVTFPLISQRSFYRWRKEVRESLEYLEQYPSVSYSAFCQVFPVVPEEMFLRWKEVSAAQTAKADFGSESLKRNLHYPSPSKGAADSSEAGVKGSESHTVGERTVPPQNKSVDLVDMSIFSTNSPDPPAIVSSLSSSESLSAAVESICRSAGLPPLDQNVDDAEQSEEDASTSPNPGAAPLGGVAFPGMSLSQTIGAAGYKANRSSPNVKHEDAKTFGQSEQHQSSTPPGSRMRGINFPVLPNTPSSVPTPYLDATGQMMEDSFFSPRARKQSREEYLFLQQNPHMDFQEFCTHYPTISLRTFYRWKREFRQSQDYLMGLHASLQ